ncbi:bifunctional biotin--[acetyl-CoA-carboxylase] ligase/biotin operon repressor BirA [Metapseudomonas otitidis]|uniref:bifunctional biotin--[acetyl-CoA-carboxylase] ligase/biotin operon repressor BirA n=1 Tax=Metapseudomonas otitidis TaxID=319939 RepID=UPI00227B8646|nr:bifunctional biotin--[acetyl-CoA-carboxylase] ligase/biotin operon repressor BirA [Pseudomonas otitidis]WAF86494.1 bifunctional biotin--[acetyl-CoA-carboxylase] ligase/biotin operon repressor BirA [Pseudomonas otitidis]
MLNLIRLLQDGQFHSGEFLGEALGISRAAVWKHLKHLEAAYGLDIHRVRGKGYRLASPFEPLSQERLFALGEPWPIFIHESIDSTNAEALRLLSQGVQAPFVVLAEHQSGGRGRRGRAWVSPYGENLYLSCVIRIDGGARQLEGMSLLVGVAVLRVLQSLGVNSAQLKWPNDVLVAERKIAGILIELVGDPADICNVVIGVGLNVNMLGRQAEITQEWASVRSEIGSFQDRTQIAAALLCELRRCLGEGFAAVRREWEFHHAWTGREVSVLTASKRVDGVVLGIDKSGALRLDVEGTELLLNGGELSLRLRDDSRA